MLYVFFAWLGLFLFPSFSFAEITKIIIESESRLPEVTNFQSPARTKSLSARPRRG